MAGASRTPGSTDDRCREGVAASRRRLLFRRSGDSTRTGKHATVAWQSSVGVDKRTTSEFGRTALGAYLVRRFGLMLVTLFGISIVIFMLLRLTPGNIADILFDAGGFVDPADKARIEADLGLDKPIPVQYAVWIGGLLRGELGFSSHTARPATREIAPRIPITAKLAALALTF